MKMKKIWRRREEKICLKKPAENNWLKMKWKSKRNAMKKHRRAEVKISWENAAIRSLSMKARESRRLNETGGSLKSATWLAHIWNTAGEMKENWLKEGHITKKTIWRKENAVKRRRKAARENSKAACSCENRRSGGAAAAKKAKKSEEMKKKIKLRRTAENIEEERKWLWKLKCEKYSAKKAEGMQSQKAMWEIEEKIYWKLSEEKKASLKYWLSRREEEEKWLCVYTCGMKEERLHVFREEEKRGRGWHSYSAC